MDEKKPEVKSDIDLIYSAVMADTDALEDAKMALEVIKETDPGVYDEMINDTLSSINYALSNSILSAVDRLADPDQEPVAWMHTSAAGNVYFRKKPQDAVFNPQPLYLDPLRREWQGLTDDEMAAAWSQSKGDVLQRLKPFARAVEQALKEKNT
jgi:hypothetical protein